MCRRKRSRPSSRLRLTKNENRLSSSVFGCERAIGLVDEHKLMTNGPAPDARPDSDRDAPPATTGCGNVCVITGSPEPEINLPQVRGKSASFEREESPARNACGNPAVIGPRPLDRWLCVPVFQRVCPSTTSECRSLMPLSQVRNLCFDSHRGRFIKPT